MVVHKNSETTVFLNGKVVFIKSCQLRALPQEILLIVKAFELVSVSNRSEQDPRPDPLAAGLWVEFSSFPLSGKQKTARGIK